MFGVGIIQCSREKEGEDTERKDWIETATGTWVRPLPAVGMVIGRLL